MWFILHSDYQTLFLAFPLRGWGQGHKAISNTKPLRTGIIITRQNIVGRARPSYNRLPVADSAINQLLVRMKRAIDLMVCDQL